MEDKSVLAIQSHVVHGYVGNKAATFPLQLRGWDVDALNAVQFSNHTGYGSFKGQRLDGEHVETIYSGLKDQDFAYDAILTGYLPSASVVNAVGAIGKDLKSRCPDTIWLLDPVMGDEGKLYVKEDVVPAYKSILKNNNLVTITTPNHFEVELLTGVKLESKEDMLRALHILHHDFGVPHVVISSLPHPSDENKLLTVGSTRDSTTPFFIEQTKLNSYFTGTGDLFAALLLDSFKRLGPDRLAEATVVTISVLRAVLYRTWEYSRTKYSGVSTIESKAMKFHELRLVQAATELTVIEATEDIQWKTLDALPSKISPSI